MEAGIVDKGKDGHFGLCGMRERAERIGGAFSLASTPGSGTTVTLIVPRRQRTDYGKASVMSSVSIASPAKSP